MIKSTLRLVLASTLLAVAAPAFSGGMAMQMWRCEMLEGATEEDVLDHAAEWLKAAKAMKGGENLQAAVHFPVAVNANDPIDMLFTVTAPTFAEWGQFWDSYSNAPDDAVDDNNKLTVCPNSVVWQSYKVE